MIWSPSKSNSCASVMEAFLSPGMQITSLYRRWNTSYYDYDRRQVNHGSWSCFLVAKESQVTIAGRYDSSETATVPTFSFHGLSHHSVAAFVHFFVDYDIEKTFI